ncbi:hypothetical protein B0H14DRAFT_2579387 [Mycena olivaceomarginata]|nr:hypothetical protein B0H14DRAFT_2579387 [Mycena olivaceomarginata]
MNPEIAAKEDDFSFDSGWVAQPRRLWSIARNSAMELSQTVPVTHEKGDMDVQHGCHESPSPHGCKRATGSAMLPEIYLSQSKYESPDRREGLAGGKNSHFARDLRTTVSKRPIEHATGSKTREQRMIMSAGEDVSMYPNTLVEARPSPPRSDPRVRGSAGVFLTLNVSLRDPGCRGEKMEGRKGNSPRTRSSERLR